MKASSCYYHREAGAYVSLTHPRRAVQPCLAGYACYESGPPVDGQMNAFHRGITDEAGAEQWLRGETPHLLMPVRGKSVTA